MPPSPLILEDNEWPSYLAAKQAFDGCCNGTVSEEAAFEALLGCPDSWIKDITGNNPSEWGTRRKKSLILIIKTNSYGGA